MVIIIIMSGMLEILHSPMPDINGWHLMHRGYLCVQLVLMCPGQVSDVIETSLSMSIPLWH